MERVTDDLIRIDEPHVHELLRANIWQVRGRERDLVVDAGLGVASLRGHVPALFERDPVLVLTHRHLDHVGSAHEFGDRRMHPATEVDGTPASLRGPEVAALLGLEWPDAPDLLINGVPSETFEVDDYAIPPAPATAVLSDGDTIDLGDRQLRVLHLPGHTPGCLCLFDEHSGALFSGDVVYDDVLLDELPESDIPAYFDSMRRLRSLPVEVVYPGHGDPFDGDRLGELVDAYVAARSRNRSS
ncbi:MBL fold metallo-hydrolase [Nocardioides immobilis]|uniref:MBL fold metallo-hydrolase n=1 Tax=Nocardioides immobilis TaxID=2049295 RepID=A0A417Y3X8_9ACTN|nr:MBL fold metallo-hydrolase [Nocardioides immobilis]